MGTHTRHSSANARFPLNIVLLFNPLANRITGVCLCMWCGWGDVGRGSSRKYTPLPAVLTVVFFLCFLPPREPTTSACHLQFPRRGVQIKRPLLCSSSDWRTCYCFYYFFFKNNNYTLLSYFPAVYYTSWYYIITHIILYARQTV